MDEVLARLLAVGDDVDAGILLQLDGEKRRVALAGFEVRPGKPPRRPQLVGFGKAWAGCPGCWSRTSFSFSQRAVHPG
jgi:hypothetical protein